MSPYDDLLDQPLSPLDQVRVALRHDHDLALALTIQGQLTPDQVLDAWATSMNYPVILRALDLGADPMRVLELKPASRIRHTLFSWAALAPDPIVWKALLRNPQAADWAHATVTVDDTGRELPLPHLLAQLGRWWTLEQVRQLDPACHWPMDAQGRAPWQQVGPDHMATAVPALKALGLMPTSMAEINAAQLPAYRGKERQLALAFLDDLRAELGQAATPDSVAQQFIEACVALRTDNTVTAVNLTLPRDLVQAVQALPHDAWITPYPIKGARQGQWTMVGALAWAQAVQGQVRPEHQGARSSANEVPLSDLGLATRLQAWPTDHPTWDHPLMKRKGQAVTLRGLVGWLALTALPEASAADTTTPALLAQALDTWPQVRQELPTFLPALGPLSQRKGQALLQELWLTLPRGARDARKRFLPETPWDAFRHALGWSLADRLKALAQGVQDHLVGDRTLTERTGFTQVAEWVQAHAQAHSNPPVWTLEEGQAFQQALFRRAPLDFSTSFTQWAKDQLKAQRDPVAPFQRVGLPLTDEAAAQHFREPLDFLGQLNSLRRQQVLAQQSPASTVSRSRPRA